MTEVEWLACDDPEPMFQFLKGKVSDRKLRLFACSCCRKIWHLLTDERCRRAVTVAEEFADGTASFERLCISHEEATAAAQAALEATIHLNDETNEYPPSAVRYACDDLRFWDMHHAAGVCAADTELATCVAIDIKGYDGPNPRIASRIVQLLLLRDIFGNPFRPVTVSPAWLAWNHGTVPKLAQAIYDERRFADMPILADALEEAGCTSADILAHCRQPAEHVRGCWVVDLLLGKE